MKERDFEYRDFTIQDLHYLRFREQQIRKKYTRKGVRVVAFGNANIRDTNQSLESDNLIELINFSRWYEHFISFSNMFSVEEQIGDDVDELTRLSNLHNYFKEASCFETFREPVLKPSSWKEWVVEPNHKRFFYYEHDIKKVRREYLGYKLNIGNNIALSGEQWKEVALNLAEKEDVETLYTMLLADWYEIDIEETLKSEPLSFRI